MSDAFTALAALVALGAPVLAGPVGVVEAQPVLALHDTVEAGASRSIPVAFRDGEPAGRLGVDRATMRRADLPPVFVDALFAVEDANFQKHMGIDPAGLGRAVFGAAAGRTDAGGGSTITQQLAKNALTGDSATLDRKVAEAISAVMTESVASKDQILESYVNAVYFGRRAEGGAQAARNWFGLDWNAIDLPQAAFLAGVLRAPSGLDPARNPERATERRAHVLGRMATLGMIDEAERRAAAESPLGVIPPPPPPQPGVAPSDVDYWALSEARRFLGNGPYLGHSRDEPFRTTLDAQAQAFAQAALDSALGPINRQLGDEPLGRVAQGVLERGATNPSVLWAAAGRVVGRMPEGAIRAVVGPDRTLLLEPPVVDGVGEGADESVGAAPTPQTTAATGDAAAQPAAPAPVPAAPRGAQPGDVYAVLPDGSVRGRPPVQGAMVVIDTRTGETIASVGGVRSWASGFDRTRAQRQPGSSIKPFVWLAALENGVGPEDWVSNEPVAIFVGDEMWSPDNYSEGGGGYVQVFTALERSYNRVAARLADHVGMEAVRRVLVSANVYPPDEPGALLPAASIGAIETSPHRMALGTAALDWRRSELASRQALQDLERMMRGVVVRGTAGGVFAEGPDGVVGKTGTSQEHRDSWFIGRTGDLAFAVWVGRDDDDPLPAFGGRRATGGSVAGPIAAAFLRDAAAAGITTEQLDAGLFSSSAVPYYLAPEPEPAPYPEAATRGGGGGWWGGGWSGSAQSAPPPAASEWRPGWAQ